MASPGSPDLYRNFYLPRLPREYYQADAVVHWTMPINYRATGWLNDAFHHDFREVMLHTAARERLLCPVYCLMPDHIHLLWMGLSLESDQLNGMSFLRTHLEPKLSSAKFQHHAQDHVLREEQRRKNSFAFVCRYVLENPVRARLVEKFDQWKFSGAVVPGYPTFHPTDPGYWPTFWKVFAEAREADAGKIKRPPVNFSPQQPTSGGSDQRRFTTTPRTHLSPGQAS